MLWGVWLEAGSGGRAPREYVAAANELTFRQRVSTNWRVRLGRSASDPAAARYAVAAVRRARRNNPGSRLFRLTRIVLGMGLLATLSIAGGLWVATTGSRIEGSIFGLFFVWMGVVSFLEAYHGPAAERANRLMLDSVGLPYSSFEDLSPAMHRPLFVASAAAAGFAVIWSLYVLQPTILGRALPNDLGPVGGFVYATIVIGGMWFGNRLKRQPPMGELGSFKPYKSYR